MENHTINEAGIEEIRQQLIAKCKDNEFLGWLADDLKDSKETQGMLGSWAWELECALDEGGSEIEIPSRYTKSGHVEWLSVSDSGVDVEVVDA